MKPEAYRWIATISLLPALVLAAFVQDGFAVTMLSLTAFGLWFE